MADVPRVGSDAGIDEVEAALARRRVAWSWSGWSPTRLHGPRRSRSRAVPRGDARRRRRVHRVATRAAPVRCSRVRREFGALAAHPTVLGTLDRVLGDHATSYQLHLTQVIEIGPGEPAQLVHRDQWAFDFFPFPAGLRGRVPHDVGDERLHRGERRDARHPRQSPLRGQAAAHGGRDGSRGDAEGLGAPLPRVAVPRRRREPFGAARGAGSTSATRCRGCAKRRTSTWRARPRSRGAARGRSPASRATAGRVRARLLRRSARSVRRGARRARRGPGRASWPTS